ncbi:hypothetical protein GCM10007874_39170 [Labrys miyagiensis]|uniref:DUF2127 domain-containing protein n=1 Tax=Labrys miyagiensis TaxID=346912 RepID=A0ABQ6CL51_9HYPH|nr:DUF2127 domain-containing protein [Labrys miyagiensis]GLS20900.1 hypothetical protein GCM10007874_39170 [Labrys miyagiensis]
MNEEQVHHAFLVSVFLKGAHALIECIGGLALALISTETIARLVRALTQDELSENPHDFLASHLQAWAQGFSLQSKHFYAFYLLSHGLVKVFLVIGLLRGKAWSYPASLVVLGLFILYQLYRYSYTGSIGLLVLTAFDVVVMAMIWWEYRLVRHKLA